MALVTLIFQDSICPLACGCLKSCEDRLIAPAIEDNFYPISSATSSVTAMLAKANSAESPLSSAAIPTSFLVKPQEAYSVVVENIPLLLFS